jgi:hypothetical protein
MMNQRGQALIQALVSVAIMGIVIMGFMSMMSTQRRQMLGVGEKLSSIDLERVVNTTWAEGSVCTFLLAGPGITPFQFDPTTLKNAKPTFPVGQIPATNSANSTALVVADDKTPPMPDRTTLVVPKIQIQDVDCAIQPCSATSTLFTANLAILFDGKKLVTPLAPVLIPFQFKTAVSPTLPNTQVVSACIGNGSGGGGGSGGPPSGAPSVAALGCHMWTVPTYNTITVKLWGAGGSAGDAVGGFSFFAGVLAGGGYGSSYAGPEGPGAGGFASGGDTNLNGNSGTTAAGGSAPNGGAGGAVNSAPSTIVNGGYPGGGAGYVSGYLRSAPPPASGSGAFAQKTFNSGDLTPGSKVLVCTGLNSFYGVFAYGMGADGRVEIYLK